MTEAVRVSILDELQERFPGALTPQETRDGIPTVWAAPGQAHDLLRYLKEEAQPAYKMLFDLTAIDERMRGHRPGQPKSDFSVVYTLLSYERNSDIRVKVALEGENPSLPSIVDLWPMANWYERELWDMFGITATGHPLLRRILMPPTWEGHPLRKEDPARGTEIRPYVMGQIKAMEEANALQFDPTEWGMTRGTADTEYMFLNVGPQHPGTHGPFRIILALDGEEIVDAIPDIGFHHRAAEKMAERQSWHTYIPYTDRVDYLGGVLNEFPYVMAVEKLAGIDVPPRAQIIRVMMAELFRISNHLVFLGTYAQDLGAMSPVFFMFNDREQVLKVIEAVTGARMHPGWFRIGGTSADLPNGWEKLIRDYLSFQLGKMDEYDRILMDSPIFRGRTVGIAPMTTDQAVEWGVTGPFLRSTGFAWDWRKQRPYSCYDQLEFDVPTGEQGDCYDRAVVHMREIRESLRIIRQCVDNMPAGPYKSAHPQATPPVKERTMHDIETLIDHFLNVSWGPVIPPGEALVASEGSKGSYGYYAISDGNVSAYRLHIRTASFPHLQTIPMQARGLMVPDLLAILGSIDFVMGDVDR